MRPTHAIIGNKMFVSDILPASEVERHYLIKDGDTNSEKRSNNFYNRMKEKEIIE